MPHSSGKKKYSKAEVSNSSHLKRAVARGQFTPASTPIAKRLEMAKEVARLRKRKRVDAAITGVAPRGGNKPKQPAQPNKPLPGGKPGAFFREVAGIGRLTDVLTPKPKKRGRR